MVKRNSDAPLIRFLPADAAPSDKSPKTPVCAYRSVSTEQLAALQRAAAFLECPVEHLLLASFAALLGRLTRQDTLVIRVGANEQAFFQLGGDCSFLQVVIQGAGRSLTVGLPVEHHEVSYEFLIDRLHSHLIEESGLRLTVRERGSQLEMASATGLWHEEVLETWLSYLMNAVKAVCQDPYQLVSHIPLWEEAEAFSFYQAFNRTHTEFPGATTVQGQFTEQAAQRPSAIAVQSGTRRYTYRELDQRSSELAQRLIAAGAGPDRAVAVCMSRSVDLSVALLATLKSGSLYVPLDPHHPAKRLHSILEECNAAAVLTDSSIGEAVSNELKMGGATVIVVDQHTGKMSGLPALPASIDPDSLAYTIYTSGTTGKPKGVRITHRNLTNLINSMGRKPGIRSSDRTLAVVPITFDIATMDMFLPLCSGGTLVIASREEGLDPFRLARLLKDHDITRMQATPATWRMLITTGWSGKQNLKMLAGGEALPRELANDLSRLGGELWNCYGPTETTIWSSVLQIFPESGIVPIGSPIANTSFYIMDEAGFPVPPGVPGELYIGGMGVSQGYVNRPELTAQRFVPDTFAPQRGGFLFRTGDLVRLRSGNDLEFFGRLDYQVKLRGFRIELGEIESVLRAYPGITDAVTVLREDLPGEPRLVAYVTTNHASQSNQSSQSNPSSLDHEALRRHAASYLPDYMLPSPIVYLDRLPLTSSGKIDRRALPPPESVVGSQSAERPQAALASDELESKLLAIFREVLRNESIGVTDSFFRFGGYSLMTVQLFARIDRDLQVRLPISLLFDAPTVRDLAHVIRRGISPSVIVPIRPEGQSAPLFVIHSYLLYSAMLDIVESDRPVYGVREMGDSRDLQSVEERAGRYAGEILQVYSGGPLFLAGWCAAGTLTVEIARQLRAAGHQVGLVALFDAERPGHTAERGLRAAASRAGKRISFHAGRLYRFTWKEKNEYIRQAIVRNWNWLVDSYFTTNYRNALWLQRKLGVTVSTATLNTVYARISDLQKASDRPYPGRLDLFRAADVPDVSGEDETLGWQAIAQGGVEVTYVPGDHESMFLQPNVGALAQRLQSMLQKNDPSAMTA